jgi:hypothetical protein
MSLLSTLAAVRARYEEEDTCMAYEEEDTLAAVRARSQPHAALFLSITRSRRMCSGQSTNHVVSNRRLSMSQGFWAHRGNTSGTHYEHIEPVPTGFLVPQKHVCVGVKRGLVSVKRDLVKKKKRPGPTEADSSLQQSQSRHFPA